MLAAAQDHCHSRGAAHGHGSSGLIFINISRLSGRPASVLVANNCHHASLSLIPHLIQFTIPGRRVIQNSQHHYYGPRVNVNILH